MASAEYVLSLQGSRVSFKSKIGPEQLLIAFERTIRVPDNRNVNNLPPGLGEFPLYKVEDYKDRLPKDMSAKQGLFMPIYQREAMWINFKASTPFLIKIYAGGVNVVSGQHYENTLDAKTRHNKVQADRKFLQDYVVVPEQKWIDGIATGKGIVKQFVAMPMGQGYSVEAQVTGEESMGGLQFEITPMKPDAFKISIPIVQVFDGKLEGTEMDVFVKTLTGRTATVKIGSENTVEHLKCIIHEREGIPVDQQGLIFAGHPLNDVQTLNHYGIKRELTIHLVLRLRGGGSRPEMVIAAGGSIKQNIVRDEYDSNDWRRPATVTFNLQLLNSSSFEYMTGISAPPTPITAAVYARHGFPFFDMYEEPTDVHGDFAKVRSIAQIEGRVEKSQSFPLVHLGSECHAVVRANMSTKSEIDITELVDDPDRLLNTTGPFNQLRTVTELAADLDRLAAE